MLHIFWDYTSCPLRKSAESPTEIKNAFLKIAKDLDLPASSYTALKINIFSRNPKIDSSKNQSWDMLNEWRTAGATIWYVNDGVHGTLESRAQEWFYSVLKKPASSSFLVVTANRTLWSSVFAFNGKIGFGWSLDVKTTDGKPLGHAKVHRCAPAVIADAEYEWDTTVGAVIPYDGDSGEDEFDATRFVASFSESADSSFSEDSDEPVSADVVPFSASLDFADTLQIMWDYENCNLRSKVGFADVIQSFDLVASEKNVSQMCITLFCKHFDFGVAPTQATIQDLRALGVSVYMANENIREICDDMIVKEIAARAKFAMAGPMLLVTGDRKLIKRVHALVLEASTGNHDYLGAFEFCGHSHTNPSNRYYWDSSSGICEQN